jgi:hypothetical protein
MSDILHSLDERQRRWVCVALCKIALNTWRRYIKCSKSRQLRYVTTTPAMYQKIDALLPADAYAAALLGRDHVNAEKRYVEPMCAIQDEDWKLPTHVEWAYLAIHNLFRRYALSDLTIPAWIIANQALSSIEDSGQWRQVLNETIEKVKMDDC